MRKHFDKALRFGSAILACLGVSLGQVGFANAQTRDAVVESVVDPMYSNNDSLPELPAFDADQLENLDTDDFDEESAEIEEAVFEKKAATGSAKVRRVKVNKLMGARKSAPAGIPEGKYPSAYADMPELLDVPTWCVGQEKILRLGAHKAYAVKIKIPGLRPSSFIDAHKRYDTYGQRALGIAILIAKADVAPYAKYLNIRPWLRLRATRSGVFRGSVTVFSTKADYQSDRGEPLSFWWNVTSCAEPTPAPTIVPTPPPAPVVVPVTPPPAAPTPPPPPKPGDHVILDGVYTQGFQNRRPGNLGDENTQVTVSGEYQHMFSDLAFGSIKLANAPSFEGWNPDLPVEAADDLLQISGHAGLRSGYDLLSAGLGLNLSLIPSQQGGISKYPASLILRAQKEMNWFTTWRLHAQTIYSWNNWFGYRAGLDAAITDTFGLTAGVSGQVPNGNPGALPAAGAYLLLGDLRLSLMGGITGGTPALILGARWDHELKEAK